MKIKEAQMRERVRKSSVLLNTHMQKLITVLLGSIVISLMVLVTMLATAFYYIAYLLQSNSSTAWGIRVIILSILLLIIIPATNIQISHQDIPLTSNTSY